MPGTGSNSRVFCAVNAAPVTCAPAFVAIPDTAPNGGTGGQTVTRDIPIAGAQLGMYGDVTIDSRGDLSGGTKALAITDVFGGAVMNGQASGQTGGTYVRAGRTLPVAVGDLGGGVFGLRLQITSSATVTSTTGMPSGWSWQIRINGVVS
ncbi:MAG: hypothetical protein ACOYB0_08180 [Polynucleobacter sp.]